MEVSRIRALRGPNLWSRHTAIEAVVRTEGGECAIGALPGFEDRLRARFPNIGPMRPIGHEGDISVAHALAFAALGLQAQAGCPVTFSRVTQTVERCVFQVVVEYSEEEVGRLAMELAERLCRAALEDAPFDLADALARLHELDEDVRLGPSTGSIVHAAAARGIPFRRLTQGSLVQFGWGSKQRRIQAAEVDRTGAIAETIAQDKQLTKHLLEAAGVPVPQGRPVVDADDAWAAMQEIGSAVVVKPQDGNQGKGVTVNITTREQLAAAFANAAEYGSTVMLERFVPGHDFRLLVVGHKLVAAARRDPPHVIGDGAHTVRELVDIVNSDPRRGSGHATSLTRHRAIALFVFCTLATFDRVPATLLADRHLPAKRLDALLLLGQQLRQLVAGAFAGCTCLLGRGARLLGVRHGGSGARSALAQVCDANFELLQLRVPRCHLTGCQRELDAKPPLHQFFAALRLLALAGQRPHLGLDFGDEVVEPIEVECGLLESAFGAATTITIEPNARRFLEQLTTIIGPVGEQGIDHLGFDDHAGVGAQPSPAQHVVNVAQAARGTVQQVFALARTRQAARHHHFLERDRELPVFVLEVQ